MDEWDKLLEEHRAWLATRGLPEDAWVAEQMLHFKREYLDAQPYRWRGGDLEEIFCGIFPRKVILEDGDLDDVLPQAGMFLRFLHETGKLARGGEPLPRLLAALERIRESFRELMCDTSGFGLAKSLLSAMAAEGADPTDPAALESWIREFNERPDEERARLVPGPIIGGVPLPASVPPMILPDDGVLAGQALNTMVMRQLAAFVDWVGQGRALTQKGNLKLADGKQLIGLLGTDDRFNETIGDRTFKTHSTTDLPGVDLAFRLALKARFARKERGALKRTQRGARLAKAPLEAWRGAVSAMLDLGLITAGREDYYGLRWWASDVESSVPALLCAGAIAGTPVTLASITEAAYDGLSEMYDLASLPEMPRETLPKSVTWGIEALVDRLEWLGVVSWEGATVEQAIGEYTRRSGGEMALTDLGRWFARPLLEERGYEVTGSGDLANASASALIETIGEWPEEAAEAEERIWLEARDDPVAELAAAARDARTPGDRAYALHLLDGFAAVAEPAVRALLDDDQSRPMAAMWLMAHGFEEPSFIDPRDAAVAFVQSLAIALSAGGPEAVREVFAETAGADQQAEALEHLWRVDDPGTEPVLEALAAAADRKIAKAARKAMFKLRANR